LMWPLSEMLPAASLWIILGGGALYSAGIIF